MLNIPRVSSLAVGKQVLVPYVVQSVIPLQLKIFRIFQWQHTSAALGVNAC